MSGIFCSLVASSKRRHQQNPSSSPPSADHPQRSNSNNDDEDFDLTDSDFFRIGRGTKTRRISGRAKPNLSERNETHNEMHEEEQVLVVVLPLEGG